MKSQIGMQWLLLIVLGAILAVFGKLYIITSRYVLFLVLFIITITLTYFVFLLISKKKREQSELLQKDG